MNIRRQIGRITLASIFILHPSVVLFAQQVPGFINYQGRLLDGTNLVNGNVGLSLRLFNVPGGGVSIYEDSNTVAVADGFYSTFIGDNTVSGDLSAALTNISVYVEVEVNGTVLTPREPIVSVAYALMAGAAANAASSTNFALLSVPDTTVPAAGFPSMVSGFIVGATVTTGGVGYLTPPAVVVNDGSGTGAGIVANIFDGAVVSLTVTNAGSGYTTNATLTIAPPGSNARQTFSTTNFFSGVNFMTNGGNVFAGTFVGQLATNSVTSSAISNGAIANVDLANNAVTGAKVSDGSLSGADISDESIQLQDIQPGIFWQTDGNELSPDKEFMGSTNNETVIFKANNQVALRLAPATVPNVIGGSSNNAVATGVSGDFIGGGDGNVINHDFAVIGGGATNTTAGYGSSIGGGMLNSIDTASIAASIAGGLRNQVGTNVPFAVMGGGASNTIAANARGATIAGGVQNLIAPGSADAVISGGNRNVINTNADRSVIGGGLENAIGSLADGAVIAGGQLHDVGSESDYSVIGGGNNNTVSNGVIGSVIAGGATNRIELLSLFANIDGGSGNYIGFLSTNCVIGGGRNNSISNRSVYSVIAGGTFNTIGTNVERSTISGGRNNKIEGGFGGQGNVIGGGGVNEILEGSDDSVIAGGLNNRIGKFAGYVVIGGGVNNEIDSNSFFCVVAGGNDNDIATNVESSAISGGTGNKIRFGSDFTTIAGGNNNIASNNSDYAFIAGGRENAVSGTNTFAAGRRAKALHHGSFVWGDNSNSDMASTNDNSVTMRASGGYRLFSNAGATLGAQLAPNATAWSVLSDRNAKENFEVIDSSSLLQRVADLPISAWTYKNDPEHRRYIGPVAQDFHAAFGLGNDTSISTLDADGVALAAIQALAKENKELKQENESLREEVEAIKRKLGM